MIKIAQMANAIVPTQIREVTRLATPTSLNLGIGQPDLPFPESVQNALIEFANNRRAPYTANAGTPECRRSIANHVGCDPSEVLVTVGVQEALALAIFGTIDPGDRVVVPDPSFPAYANLVHAAGADLVSIPLNEDWSWSVERVRQSFEKHQPTALILNNPSNPTGCVEKPKTIRAIARLCAEHGVTIISDDIYEDFVYGTHKFSSPRQTHPTITLKLGGLSKSYAMMGLRLGWIVAPAETIIGLTALHQHLVTSAPTISQFVTTAALEDTHARDAIVATMAARASHATNLANELLEVLPAGAGFQAPQGAFYLMLGLGADRSPIDDMAVAKSLVSEYDVVTIPGSGFGEEGAGYLRIAYTVETDILTEAFSRMRQFFANSTRNS